MTDWGNLPDLVMGEILNYVPRRDRLTCSMVCRSWNTALYSPVLWRSMTVYLDVDLNDAWTLAVTRRFGMYITSLDLAWSKPYLPRQWIRNRFSTLTNSSHNYFLLLRECNVTLTAIKLTDWYFAWKFKKMIFQLAAFLRQQTRLETINFCNANLSKSELFKLLTACVRHSSLTITHLDLHCSFHEWQNSSNSLLIEVVEQLMNLIVLKIDYSSISDKTLLAVIASGNVVLTSIEISVRDTDYRGHVVSENAWEKLVKQCPQLQVSLNLTNICHFEDIYNLLARTMPLCSFSLCCGHVWDQSRSRNYRGTLKLLIANYQDTLAKIRLQLRNNRETLDDLIIKLLKHCREITNFSYDGIVRSMEVFREICKLQCDENKIAFKNIDIKPKTMNVYNHLVVNEIWRDYAKKMQERGTDFHIESNFTNNTKIIVFY